MINKNMIVIVALIAIAAVVVGSIALVLAENGGGGTSLTKVSVSASLNLTDPSGFPIAGSIDYEQQETSPRRD